MLSPWKLHASVCGLSRKGKHYQLETLSIYQCQFVNATKRPSSCSALRKRHGFKSAVRWKIWKHILESRCLPACCAFSTLIFEQAAVRKEGHPLPTLDTPISVYLLASQREAQACPCASWRHPPPLQVNLFCVKKQQDLLLQMFVQSSHTSCIGPTWT